MKTYLITLCSAAALFAVTSYAAPVPDFFRTELPPLLPEREDANLQTIVGIPAAASTGDGGWAVLWDQWQRGEGEAGPTGHDVRLRMLPPAFNNPPANAVNWTGNAPPTVSLGRPDPSVRGRHLAGGTGGAWHLYHEGTTIKGQWCTQAAGGPEGPAIALATANLITLKVAGDGTHVWVVWLKLDGSAGYDGLVLSATAADHRVVGSFTIPFVTAGADPLLYARAGRLLMVWPSTPLMTTVSVDTAGLSTSQTAAHPGGIFMGAIPSPGGYSVFYSTTVNPSATTPAWQHYLRRMTAAGTWVEGAPAIQVAGPAEGLTPGLISGAETGVVLQPGTTWLYRADGTSVTLPRGATGGYHPGFAAGGNVLLTDAGVHQNLVRVTRVTMDRPADTFSSTLTIRRGLQSEPALGWGPQGLRLVHSLADYGSSAGQAITGVNGAMDAVEAPAFVSGTRFSSAAQAWLGSHQLVTWRRENEITGDQDDVAGAIYHTEDDGPHTLSVPEFTIAAGPGSQRGVSVAVFSNDQFYAAWREQGVDGDGLYYYSIRAAFIGLDGTVTPPGGFTVATSPYELSAVSTGVYGLIAWRAATDASSLATVIRAGSIAAARAPDEIFQVSPAGYNAVAPTVTYDGVKYTVLWRGRGVDRIYATELHGATYPVSPAGKMAREPVAVALRTGVTAVLWLEELFRFSPTKIIYMATVENGEVSAPVEVARGTFDRDTLTAATDGAGRIAFAVEDTSLDSAGLRVFTIAPEAPADPGLNIAFTGTSYVLFWNDSPVFPGSGRSVQRTSDLLSWQGAPGTPLPVAGGVAGFQPYTAGQDRLFFRLRANAAGPVLR